MNGQTVSKIADAAPAATYGAAAGSVVFWGLQVNEICAIVSTLIAFIGLGLQFWLAMHRIRKLERAQGVTAKVVSGVSIAQREVAKKVDNLEKGV